MRLGHFGDKLRRIRPLDGSDFVLPVRLLVLSSYALVVASYPVVTTQAPIILKQKPKKKEDQETNNENSLRGNGARKRTNGAKATHVVVRIYRIHTYAACMYDLKQKIKGEKAGKRETMASRVLALCATVVGNGMTLLCVVTCTTFVANLTT